MPASTNVRGPFIGAMALLALMGCAQKAQHDPCADGQQIGRFNTATDLFIANFDSKPDVDDLHTIAAVGSFLSLPDFKCVRTIAVAGAYGAQGGSYVPAPDLFALAFGSGWLDAHADRDDTVDTLVAAAAPILADGGHVWVMEAGQSDVSAAMIRALTAEQVGTDTRKHVHIVQHSDWNEQQASPGVLDYVMAEGDYILIPDGNVLGNGTPGYNATEPTLWTGVLSDARIGPMWTEAKRLADANNAVSGYDNPTIRDGGFDFSDTSEAAFIFGFDDRETVEAFLEMVRTR